MLEWCIFISFENLKNDDDEKKHFRFKLKCFQITIRFHRLTLEFVDRYMHCTCSSISDCAEQYGESKSVIFSEIDWATTRKKGIRRWWRLDWMVQHASIKNLKQLQESEQILTSGNIAAEAKTKNSRFLLVPVVVQLFWICFQFVWNHIQLWFSFAFSARMPIPPSSQSWCVCSHQRHQSLLPFTCKLVSTQFQRSVIWGRLNSYAIDDTTKECLVWRLGRWKPNTCQRIFSRKKVMILRFKHFWNYFHRSNEWDSWQFANFESNKCRR